MNYAALLLNEIDISKLTLPQMLWAAFFVFLSGGGLAAVITARSARGTNQDAELGKVRTELRSEVESQDKKLDELHAQIVKLEKEQTKKDAEQGKKDAQTAYQMRTILRFVRKVKSILQSIQTGNEHDDLISDADEILAFPCDPPPAFTPNSQHPANPPP